MKMKLLFYWPTVFLTMMTPIFSHVKDNDTCMFTVRGEDMIF